MLFRGGFSLGQKTFIILTWLNKTEVRASPESPERCPGMGHTCLTRFYKQSTSLQKQRIQNKDTDSDFIPHNCSLYCTVRKKKPGIVGCKLTIARKKSEL